MDETAKMSRLSRRDALTALAAVGAGAGLLAGCASPTLPPNPVFAPIAFPGAPISLAIERIVLTVRPRPNPDDRPADADFVAPPEQIARLWPKQRLRAAGGKYTARYIIDDASAISRPTQTGEVVLATIQVRLVMVTPYGVEEAGIGARVDSEVRFAGRPSLIQRQEALHGMSLDLAAKLDAQLTASLRSQLQPYLRSTP